MKRVFSGVDTVYAVPWVTSAICGFDAKKKYSIEIKEYHEKRSNNANAYMWVLCNKLAEQMDGYTDVDVYREHILDSNIYKHIEIREDAANTFITSWAMHGKGWICQRADYGKTDGFVIIHAYYGSSTYNTKQMAKLIDGLVQDCKAMDIETLPQEKLTAMVEAWNPK